MTLLEVLSRLSTEINYYGIAAEPTYGSLSELSRVYWDKLDTKKKIIIHLRKGYYHLVPPHVVSGLDDVLTERLDVQVDKTPLNYIKLTITQPTEAELEYVVKMLKLQNLRESAKIGRRLATGGQSLEDKYDKRSNS